MAKTKAAATSGKAKAAEPEMKKAGTAAPAPAEAPAAPEPTGFSIKLGKADGPVTFEMNGLKMLVGSKGDLSLPTATNEDQAAELCFAHKLPVDLAQFTHDEEREVMQKGKPVMETVTVSYNQHAQRVVVSPGPAPGSAIPDE